jgi:tetratricopeptide (TPR) repeat protein
VTLGPRPPTGDPTPGVVTAATGDTPVGARGVATLLVARAAIFDAAMAALVSAWAGYFVFVGMPALTFHVWPATMTLHLVVAGGVAAYVASLVAARRLPGGTPVDAGVLAIIAAYVLATWTSVNWRVSLEASLQLAIGIVAFYVIADAPFVRASTLRRAWMLVGIALATYALWTTGGDYLDYLRLARRVEGLHASNIFPPTVPRVHDVSDHPNVLAMVLVLVLPFWALATWRPEAPVDRLIGVAGVVAGAWALFLTLSRGGWLGAGVALVVAAAGGLAAVLVTEREQAGTSVTVRSLIPAGFSPTALAAAVGALALAIFGVLAFASDASTRPGWLFRSSLSPREDAWRVGREIFADHLLTGAGPNTFGLLYPTYSKHAAEYIVHTQHAHNGFLQLADDAGLVGLAALAVGATALAVAVARIWRGGDLQARLLAVGCVAGFAGLAAHNQLDAGNTWKATPVALAFVAAIAARAWRESPAAWPAWPDAWGPASRYARYAVGTMLLALFAVPLAAWWKIDHAHYEYWRGLEAFNTGDPSAVSHLQRAVDLDSSMAVYQLELGVAQVDTYLRTNQRDRGLLDAAIIHLERAAELDRYADLPRANLARAYQLAGRDDDAARAAALTRLATYHVTPVLFVGEVYEDLGRTDDAISTYGQAISMDAGLSTSSFWQFTPFRRQHFDAILKASTIGINPCTYGSYLVEASRPSAAPDTAPPLAVSQEQLRKAADDCQFFLFTARLGDDLGTRTALARIDIALGKLDEAEGHLRFAIDRQPDFGPARTEFGRLLAARGDIDGARRQWLRGGELDQPESLLLLGESYEPGRVPDDIRSRLEDQLAKSGSSIRNDLVTVLYFRMRYQRLSPVAPVVPGDWQAAVPRLYAEMAAAVARWGASR